MDAYFLKINRLSAASLQSLHRRLLISSFHQLHVPGRRSIDQGDFTDAQPPEETPSTQTTPSTQWDLHLSVTSKHVNRTLPTPSRRWKELQTEILLRNKRTCSSCGYLSPHPEGRHMVIDHKDGNALNNYSLNLMLLCPPCHAIRHCGFSGLQDWITVSKSTMKQIEIVRKTREIFEKTGVIPHPYRIDPSVKLVRISAVELANMLLTTPWKYLPEGYQSLRGFFTKQSSRLFQYTMLNENLDTKMLKDDSNESQRDNSDEALRNNSDGKAAEIAVHETSRPSISRSKKHHKSSQVIYNSRLPSKTLKRQVRWIHVHNPQSLAKSENESPNLDRLSSAWDALCAVGQSTLEEIDHLAQNYNVLTGKWLVFVSSDEVDDLWERVVKSTLSGTLGISAKVSGRDKEDVPSMHVISVYNADYRSLADVYRVRDELRRLGVERRIAYKPDVYSHCRIYLDNSWGIPPSRYHN